MFKHGLNQGSVKSSIRSNVSSTVSACLRAEADMAALLARQKLLDEKHALEQQEDEIRKQKERLQLEAEKATSSAKINVLRTSGSSVRSTSKKLDGTESYFEKRLNIHAESFVPHKDEKDGGGPPVFKDAALPMFHLQNANAPSSRNISSEHNTVSIMEKQNEITSMLVQQQSLALLPKRDIRIFDGNPLQFHAFMQSFEQIIEQRAANGVDCLNYVDQYTRGQPQQLIRSCEHMTDGNGYATAKALLQEHFGNDHVIASAYMNRILSWPSIKSQDAKALQHSVCSYVDAVMP